jgi:hypothetical protein
MASELAAVPAVPLRANPDAAMIIYTALMLVITAGLLLWWLCSLAERRAGPALPLMLAGGALTGLMEAWLDNVVLVAYPQHQNLPVIHAVGRSVPLFVPIGYAWFCGGLLYLVARYLQRAGASPQRIFVIWAVIVLVDFGAIGLSSWIGILRFFGHPPLNIAGYPLWWASFDGLDVILGGALTLILLDHLRGRRQAWFVLVPPLALGAACGIVGWPISTALNSSWSEAAKYGCALATIALSLAAITAIARTLPRIATLSRRLADDPRPLPPAAVEEDRPRPARQPVGIR